MTDPTDPRPAAGTRRNPIPLVMAGTLALAVAAGSFVYSTSDEVGSASNTAARHSSGGADQQGAAAPRTAPDPTPDADQQDPSSPSETGAEPTSQPRKKPSSEPEPRDQEEELTPELKRLRDELARIAPLDETGAATPEPEQLPASSAHAAAPGQPGNGFADPSTTRVFDIDLFEQNVRDAYDGKTVGYTFSIGKAGKLYSEDGVGQARTEADGGPVSQSAKKPMTVASVSKSLTAIAVLRLLEQKQISVDDPIGPWLPADWKPGKGVAKITFRELMTNTSGLRQNYESATGSKGGVTSTTANIKKAVEQDLGSKSYDYANMNFGIFRIIVPKMLGFDPADYYPLNVFLSDFFDKHTGKLFDDYVRKQYQSVGAKVSCQQPDSNQTVLYRMPYNGASGWETPSYVLGCGGYGYYVSAHDLTKILSFRRYTDQLLSPAARTLMEDGELGWRKYAGAEGTYRGHAGAWHTAKGGMRSCVMSFHIHVDASLMTNTTGDGVTSPCAVLRDAFDSAWVSK